MKNEFDIVTVGNLCLDIRQYPGKLAEPGEKIKTIRPYEISCGGPAAVAAAVGAKLGLKTGFKGAVADDLFGHMAIEDLNRHGVDTSLITICKDSMAKTAIATVQVTNDGERSITSDHGCNLVIHDSEEYSAKVLEFDGKDLKASLKAIEMNPNADTVLDAGRVNESTRKLGSLVDIVACSREFAEKYVEEITGVKKFSLNNSENIAIALELMEEEFPNNIFITLGSKGSVYKEDGYIKLVPPLDLEKLGLSVKDTTGAGDAFHGGIAVALLTELRNSKYDIIKFATIVAGLSVTKSGGITSLPTSDEINLGWMSYEDNVIILNPKEKELIR